MNGVVQGGWGFVIAAYSITGVGLIAYTVRVLLGLREAKRHDR